MFENCKIFPLFFIHRLTILSICNQYFYYCEIIKICGVLFSLLVNLSQAHRATLFSYTWIINVLINNGYKFMDEVSDP